VRYQRSWLTFTLIVAFGLFPLGTGMYGALRTIELTGSRGVPNYWALGFCVAWSALGLVAGLRSALVAVVATPDELIIRNFFTTRRIPWTDVRTVDRPWPFINAGLYSGFANRGNRLHIRLTDGTTRIAFAYSPAGFDRPEFADAVIEDLRRYANCAKRSR
jgi:hypothetical protein